MQPPVFFVVGPVGHGKSTAREILSKATYLKGASCSDVIYRFLAVRRNTTVEELRKIPKEELRPALVEAGDFMVGRIGKIEEVAANAEIDQSLYRIPSLLIRTLYLNGNNVIDGVRRRLELVDAIGHLEWNGIRALTIYVEDPRKPQIADNSEDLKDLSDERILNDGTPEELEIKLRAILEKHFGKQDETPAPMEVAE